MKFLVLVCALMTVWAYAGEDVGETAKGDPMTEVGLNPGGMTEGSSGDVQGALQANIKKDHEIAKSCPLCSPQTPLGVDPEGTPIVPAGSGGSKTNGDDGQQ